MIFRHKIVNDLAWVISSVPLMSFSPTINNVKVIDKEWFEAEYLRCKKFLNEQDSNPDLLEEFMHFEGRQLLGKRFERFIEYWLRFSGKFEVIVSNMPITSNKITLGEIDYIIQDKLSKEIWHLEVAAKYYLGYDNSNLLSNWKGINAKDTLLDKMTKFEKQLSLFDRQEGKDFLEDNKLKKPSPALMMKGFFFYYWKDFKKASSPKFSEPNHNTGLFLKQKEVKDFFISNNSWKVLSKRNWFAKYIASNHEEVYSEISIQSRIHELMAAYDFGVMLARLKYEDGHFIEDLRVVVTRNDWPLER